MRPLTNAPLSAAKDPLVMVSAGATRTLARFLSSRIQLRPLLYASGAAVGTVFLYYYIMKSYGPVQAVSTDSSLPDPESDVTRATAAENERKYKEAMESRAQLQNRMFELMAEVNMLRKLVRQLEHQQASDCETIHGLKMDNEEKNLELRTLRSRQDNANEVLFKDYQAVCLAQAKLISHYYELREQRDELQRATAAEAENKDEQEMEPIAQLQNGNDEPMAQENTLQQSGQELEEEQASDCDTINDNKTDNDQKSLELGTLRSCYSKMNGILFKDYKSVCLAHTKLISHYYQLREQHDKLQREYEREWEAHSILMSEYDLMSSNYSIEAIQNERKFREAIESNAQLQNRTSELTAQVNMLQEMVQQLEDQQALDCETICGIKRDGEKKSQELSTLRSRWNKVNEVLFKDYQAVCLAQSKLIFEHKELMNQHEKIQRESEEEWQYQTFLRAQFDWMKDTISDNKKSLMNFQVTLDEAAIAYEKLKKSNIQLEKEKSDLMDHVEKLRGTVQQLEEMLSEANMTCHAIRQDRDNAQEAYRILKAQYARRY